MEYANSSAIFSTDGLYRYKLTRRWLDVPEQDCRYIAWIGLNPSTADERQDDPTIRRIVQYSMDWGYGGMIMLNAFAYRATAPADMKAHAEPVGKKNNQHIQEVAESVRTVVACWGNHGDHLDRHLEITRIVPWRKLYCLKYTKKGMPSHPLYLSKKLSPVPYLYLESKS